MSNIRRIVVLVVVATVFSFGAVGCKSAGKERADQTEKKTEHPKGDHPKH